MTRLAGIDLNLLVALLALLEERGVTRAGRRVGLSQPAMSAALARLRELLKDPLLVRTPRGMLLTPRASDLIVPLKHLLQEIERTLEPPEAFEPATARVTFTLACSDFAGMVLLPALMERLRRLAPGATVVLSSVSGAQAAIALESQEIDVLLALSGAEITGAYRQTIYRDTFSCLIRADHPEVGPTWSLEDFVRLAHILIAPLGGELGLVDQLLAEQKLSRRIALRLPHFLLAPHIVASTDLVGTFPTQMAQAFAHMLPLRVLAPPLEVPAFALAQYWHQRSHLVPAHRWLRELLVTLPKYLWKLPNQPVC